MLKERLETIIDAVAKGHILSDSELDRLLDYKSYPCEVQEQKALKSDDAYNIVYGNEGRIVRAKTRNQRRLVDEYYKNDLIFALGPAGTGKTYTAIALAVRALKNREVKKLILTRPAVEAGERLGFLPGDMKEKLDPYLQPLYDALHDMIQPRKLQILMEEGIIQIAPGLYERPHSGQCVRHPGRGPEHIAGAVEDVPDPYGQQRQVYRHGRRDSDRPAQQTGLGADARSGTGQKYQGHRGHQFRHRRHGAPSPGH